MAQPAHRMDAPEPTPVELRYRYHRAQRQVRDNRRVETRLARYRFYILVAVLIALAVAFVLGSWHEVQRLFGL
ncbi:MAG: hypothetical protein JOY72_03350 [Actinobacteria bacterium]|nr:hypothetical protein [Actinomycetota bacterium]MBV8479316.1 hypothetical protein [Actinomycetota bacterium]